MWLFVIKILFSLPAASRLAPAGGLIFSPLVGGERRRALTGGGFIRFGIKSPP
jgi:hypothetical protein